MSEQKTAPSEVHTPLPMAHEHWYVKVETHGDVLFWSDTKGGYGGKGDLTPEDEATLKAAGETLIAFWGGYTDREQAFLERADTANEKARAAVNERPALLSRLRKMEEALRAAQGLAKIARELTGCPADDDYVEQVSRQIDAALSE